ncbi:tetratricopeptide repeat protein, partial [Mycobacteroides abscessus]|nr:tetratricopeptide repeat protein [Mycobacteroides abscessus]
MGQDASQRGPRQQGPRRQGPGRPARDAGARRDDRGSGAARPRRSDERPQRSDERGGDRPQRNQSPRPRRTEDRPAPRNFGPHIPDEVEAKQLAPDVRAELRTLDKNTAETVARHLVTAGNLLDEDPQAALEHAKAAKSRAARIAAVREAVGIAAYHCGDWA